MFIDMVITLVVLFMHRISKAVSYNIPVFCHYKWLKVNLLVLLVSEVTAFMLLFIPSYVVWGILSLLFVFCFFCSVMVFIAGASLIGMKFGRRCHQCPMQVF